MAVEAGKAGDDVLGKLGLNLKEISVVGNGCDDLVHVVGLVGVLGDDLVEQVGLAVNGVVALASWRFFHVIGRNVRQQCLNHIHALLLGLCGKGGHTTLGGMYAGTSQMLGVNVLACNGLYYLRAGKEHIAGLLLHDDEVGKSG